MKGKWLLDDYIWSFITVVLILVFIVTDWNFIPYLALISTTVLFTKSLFT